MPTVDLPAHNISIFDSSGGAVITGGPEALSTPGAEGGFVTFTRNFGDDVLEPDIRVGITDAGVAAVGFGVWEQPAGATVTSMQFVAEGYYPFERTVIDQADFVSHYGPDGGATAFPVGYAPLVFVRYGGDPYPSFGGFNFSQFPVGSFADDHEALVAPGEINLRNYVISPGGPDRGELGLAPRVTMAGYPFHVPALGQQVVLLYLAIRITYTVGRPSPVRVIGRKNDGLVRSGTQTIRRNTAQHSIRTLGAQR